MDPSPQRDEYFADVTSDILSRWREGRRNLSHFWRTFFGGGASEDVTTFVKESATGATTSMGRLARRGAPLEAIVAAAAVGFDQAVFAGIGTLLVGFSTRAITSFRTVRHEAAASPYRYLTVLENAGVTFRSADTAQNSA